MYTVGQVNANLKNMLQDLGVVKASAVYLLNKLSHDAPESFMGAGEGEMSPEDSQAISPGLEGAEPETGAGVPGEPGAEGKPGEKKAPEVKTPEEAKKVVNEAIVDLKSVVEGIDNITEQGTDMEQKTSSQTFRLSSKVTSEIGVLTNQAVAALNDAQDAIAHYAWLLKKKSNTTPSGNVFVENVKEGVKVWKELGQVLGTAVAPTGAEFSGDKLLPKQPRAVEIKHFEAGNEKFHTDKAKDDKMPNAAAEPRLTDEGNPHELGAYVNSKAVAKNDKFSSAIVIRTLNKDKKGKYAVVTWDKLNDTIGPKTATNYAKFLSPGFSQNLEMHAKKNGIDALAAFLNADVDTIGLQSTAREPKVEDKAKLRAYYADAYGDAEFAKELTSKDQKPVKTGTELAMGINQDKAGNVAKGGDDMNVAYKPQVDSAEEVEGGLEGGRKEDSLGTGGAPVKGASLEVRQAKARQAVDLARLAASRGQIKFTKAAVAEKAHEIVKFSDEKFTAYKEILQSMPEVNSALKEARIPDDEEVEQGIIGNRHEAVRDPKAPVPTEGLNTQVKSDAKISQASIDAQKTRTANVVPQLQVTSALTKESFVNNMDTLQNRLAKKGLTLPGSVRRVGPVYKKH